MVRVAPFLAHLPPVERAASVAAPSYDSVSAERRGVLRDGRPDSILHVVDPAVPEGIAGHEKHLRARSELERLILTGALAPAPGPAMFVYRITTVDHSQTGVVAAVPVAGYREGWIVRHETTMVDREDDFADFLGAVRALPTPVFLAHRDIPAVAGMIAAVTEVEPVLSVDVEGQSHTLWAVPEGSATERLAAGFETVDRLYVADGHHRLAAQSRLAASSGPGPESEVVAALFPTSESRILPFHRRVVDFDGKTPDVLVREIGERAPIRRAESHEPGGRGAVGMILDGDTYQIDVAGLMSSRGGDPTASLDVSLLQDEVLAPVFGIDDPRTDPRLEVVAGVVDIAAVHRARGGGGAAFALHPIPVETLLDVSDAGGTMPPKSTLFNPKPRSGLVVRLFD